MLRSCHPMRLLVARRCRLAECESREHPDTQAEEHGKTAPCDLTAMVGKGGESAPEHPRGYRCHHNREQADADERDKERGEGQLGAAPSSRHGGERTVPRETGGPGRRRKRLLGTCAVKWSNPIWAFPPVSSSRDAWRGASWRIPSWTTSTRLRRQKERESAAWAAGPAPGEGRAQGEGPGQDRASASAPRWGWRRAQAQGPPGSLLSSPSQPRNEPNSHDHHTPGGENRQGPSGQARSSTRFSQASRQ